MKIHSIEVIGLLVFGLGLGAPAFADAPQIEEVPVRHVFFPATGYDDNDNVQIMIEGPLPDVCYVVGDHSFRIDAATHVITVHQSAWRRWDGPCNTGDMLPDSQFSEEISLGHMNAGDYLVAYTDDNGAALNKKLHVDRAHVSTMDDFNYAHVTTLDIKALNLDNAPVIFKIRGLLSSVCNALRDPIDVSVNGDAIVIKPIEVPASSCVPVPGDMGLGRVFEKTIDLGVLKAGEYLAHVRSQGGRAVEQTFNVLTPLH